jgi:DNA-binding transcriptional ArsR family regulator
MTVKTKRRKSRAGHRHKTIEEIVPWTLRHRTRVYILTILNEGIYTVEEIAEIIGLPTKKVAHHVKELSDAGSIELAKTEPARNAIRHYYRATEMACYSSEDLAKMTPQERQVTAGLIIQCMSAEILAALWGGKLKDDLQIALAWRWLNVDEQGRREIAEEQVQSWYRFFGIEARSTNRRAKTGEPSRSIVVASLGFERERTSARHPVQVETDEIASEITHGSPLATTPGRWDSVEDSVAFALSHRTRVYILTILNEGIYTADEIAEIIGQEPNAVAHHLKKMTEARSIEIAKSAKVSGGTKYWYRATEMPCYDADDLAKMTSEERQATAALIVQHLSAEVLAALWGGKVKDDLLVALAWRWFNVDEQGRREISEEQEESWVRMQAIEARSTNRRAETGEPAHSIVVACFGFERERTSPRPPVQSDTDVLAAAIAAG